MARVLYPHLFMPLRTKGASKASRQILIFLYKISIFQDFEDNIGQKI